MAGRLRKKSGLKSFCRAGFGALGLTCCAALFAADVDPRTLLAQVAASPLDSTAATDANAADATPTDTTAPLPADMPVQPETPVVPGAPGETLPAETNTSPQSQFVAPIQDSLHYPVSAWPVVTGQSPLFGTEQIAAFSQEELLQGKWDLRPHGSISTVYDGNVFVNNHDQQSDFITNISAGVTLRVGHPEAPLYLLADYTLGAQIFASHSHEDSLEQAASIGLLMDFKKLTLGFQASVQSGSVASIDIGNRVQETLVAGGVNASYTLGEKVSITGNVTETAGIYGGGFIDSEDTEFEAY